MFRKPVVTFLVVALQIVWKGTHSIRCVSSGISEDGVGRLSDCHEIKECPPGQTCYIEKFLSLKTYTPRYTAGCRDVHECNLMQCNKKVLGKKPRALGHATTTPPTVYTFNRLVICSVCCYNNMCNTQGCGGNLSVSVAGGQELMPCFKCDNQRQNDPPCSNFGFCQSNERCVTEYINGFGTPYYKLGCMHHSSCELLDKFATMNHEKTLTECCYLHLCNQSPFQMNKTGDNVIQQLACPTDLVLTSRTLRPATTTITTTTTTTSKPTTATPKPTTTTTTTPITTTITTTTETTRPDTTTTSRPTTTTMLTPRLRSPCLSCINSPTELTNCRIVHCNQNELCFVEVSGNIVNAGCQAKLSCHIIVVVGKKRSYSVGRSRIRGNKRDVAIGQPRSRDATVCSTCCDPASLCLCNAREATCNFNNFHVIPFITGNCSYM